MLAALGGVFEGCLDVPLVEPPPPLLVVVITLSGPPTLQVDAHPGLRGVVTERHATAPYTYFRVSPPAGTAQWVVTMGDCPPAGEPVVVDVMATQHDFYSRRLDRTFEELSFGVARTPRPSPGA